MTATTTYNFGGSRLLVIGGASGIGAAVADLARGAGAQVKVADLHPGESADLHVDLASQDSIEDLTARVSQDWDHLDGLVITAGRSLHRPLAEVRRRDWNLLDVNVIGAATAVQQFASLLAAAPAPSVVTVASAVGMRSYPNTSVYSASKAALIQWSKCAANELASSGVRLNCVCPGPIDTPMLRGDLPAEPPFEVMAAKIGTMTALGRLGTAAEVAQAVCFLLSRAASFITGAVLLVDGGESAHDGH